MGPVGRHAGQLPELDAGVFAARLLDPRPAGDRLPPGVADFESGAGAGGDLVHDEADPLGAAGCGHHGRDLRHEYPRGPEHAGHADRQVFEKEESIIERRGGALLRPCSLAAALSSTGGVEPRPYGAIVGADAHIGPPCLPRSGLHNHAANSFLGKGFANKITPTQVQMFCGWVGAFLLIEGEVIYFFVFILWFML